DECARAGRLAMLIFSSSLMLFAACVCGRRPLMYLPMLFVMDLATGAMQPLVQSWFNEQVDSGQRATLSSFSSTFQTMGGSMGLLAGGVIADTAGIPFEWQIAGLISLLAAPIYWSLRPRQAIEIAAPSAVDQGG